MPSVRILRQLRACITIYFFKLMTQTQHSPIQSHQPSISPDTNDDSEEDYFESFMTKRDNMGNLVMEKMSQQKTRIETFWLFEAVTGHVCYFKNTLCAFIGEWNF